MPNLKIIILDHDNSNCIIEEITPEDANPRNIDRYLENLDSDGTIGSINNIDYLTTDRNIEIVDSDMLATLVGYANSYARLLEELADEKTDLNELAVAETNSGSVVLLKSFLEENSLAE